MKSLLTFGLLFLSYFLFGQTYQSEDVSFTNGDIILSGTLSFPENKSEKSKAVIFVSGSGPQNRDSEILGFKPFEVLADLFNSLGYAVLRYDDRGVGKSKGKSVGESTSEELAEDARQAYLYLRGRADIDVLGIGLLGHSEGGIVVPMVAASETEVDFLILMAGFGVKGVELSNAQGAAIQRASGMSEEYIEASGTMNRKIMEMMSDENVSEDELSAFVKKEMAKVLPLLPEYAKSVITDEEVYLQSIADGVVVQAKNPWIKFYMNYDPLPTLKKVSCSVLMLFGELDTQVLASQNKELMEKALEEAGNQDVTSITVSGANHLFQAAKTGSPQEYATLEKAFAPAFLEVLEKWLLRINNK